MYCLYNQNVWNCNPTAHRNKMIRELLDEVNADVCTFQECASYSVRTGDAPLQELMKNGYTEVDGNQNNFTPIFYKTEKFNLKDSGYHLYTGLNDADSKSITWAVLENKENGEKFAVMSTHFWWMFDSDKDNLQRLENVKELKALCDEVIKKHNVPVIIGGDFNNGPNSPQGTEPYEAMLRAGFEDIRYTAPVTTDSHTQRDCLLPDKTQDMNGEPNITIDFIFTYGSGLTAE